MPFNSLPFLLLFLPVALGLHALCIARRPGWRVAWLAGLSFAFYGWWDLRFVPVLAGSVALNWLAGEVWHRTGRGAVLSLAIVLDLALLGLYKYLGFFAGLAEAAFLAGAAFFAADGRCWERFEVAITPPRARRARGRRRRRTGRR